MSDGTTREIVGTLAGMEARNGGWMRFSVHEAGKQYPVKADTKKAEIVAQCQALLGQVVKIQVTEKPSDNLNPNTNQPYTNRFLEQIAIASAGETSSPAPQQAAPQVAAPGQPAVQGQPQNTTYAVPEHERTRQTRIMRQHCFDGAIQLVAAGKCAPDAQSMVEAAEMQMAYVIHGPARFGVQAFGSRQGIPAPDPVPQAQPEQQQLPTEPQPGTLEHPEGQVVTSEAEPGAYVCSDCGTTDPSMHSADCIPF